MGYTHVFHRPGYEWDVGVHYIGDVAPGSTTRRVFDDISDGRIEWADMGEVYDRVIIGGEIYDLPKGRRNLRDMLVSRFPAEEAGIDRYFEAVRTAVCLLPAVPGREDHVQPRSRRSPGPSCARTSRRGPTAPPARSSRSSPPTSGSSPC